MVETMATLNIESRKRKSTGIDELNATNATENVEDICVDDEQVVSYIFIRFLVCFFCIVPCN